MKENAAGASSAQQPAKPILEQPAPAPSARIAYGQMPQQFGDLRLPNAREGAQQPVPVVVIIHGGYWRNRYTLEYAGHMGAALTQQGLATWNIEYRRLGDEGGGWPGTFVDVASAIDYLRVLAQQFPLDLTRVVTLGHSAGGHLALWAAGRHRIAPESELAASDPLPVTGSISLAGVVCLRRAWELGLSDQATGQLVGGSPAQYPARYDAGSPDVLLPLGTPQVLVHGTADQNVPLELSTAYVERAHTRGDSATLMTLPDADHFAIVNPTSSVWPAIEGAVLSLLNAEH